MLCLNLYVIVFMKMSFILSRSFCSWLLMLGLFVACSREENEHVKAASEDLNIDGSCNIYTVENVEGASWTVVEAPEWITPVKSTGNVAEPLELYVESNTQVSTRAGEVQIAYANGISRTLAVSQSNEQPAVSLQRAYAVGWGFDITSYRDSRGVKDQIVNTQKLLAYREDGFVNERHTETSIQTTYGESYDELNKKLNANLNLNLNVSAFKLDLKGTFGQNALSNSKRIFSWMRGVYQERIVRLDMPSRSLQGNSLFTRDFEKERQHVIDNNGSDESIRQLISRYGTHYVSRASLGGYLDYYFSSVVEQVSKDMNIEAAINFGFSQKFNLKGDVTYKDDYDNLNEDKIETFLVKGGDAISLTNEVISGNLSDKAVSTWAATLGGADVVGNQLELIDFTVVGIYELFPDEILEKIKNYIERVLYYNDLPVTRAGKQ